MAKRSTEESLEKVVAILEEQLAYAHQQNQELSNKLDQSLQQIESLTQQIQHLTKLLFGSKTEKSKYQAPDGQASLFEEEEDPFPDSEQTEEQCQQLISYTVVRKRPKKRNDLFVEGIPTEVIHHYPDHLDCDGCLHPLTEIGHGQIVREEAEFIPASLKRIQHVEHAYECTHCKRDAAAPSVIMRGKAPQPAIQRSLAGPSVLANVIYQKFIQYLPLYRQVKEWKRHGLKANDKNLSNWVIRATEDWLTPLYERMKRLLTCRNVLHVDETTAQVIFRSDEKSAQKKAYNWVCKTIPCQGPVMLLFHSSLSRSRAVLESLIKEFQGTIICDGYSAYGNLPDIQFANCWAHYPRRMIIPEKMTNSA